MDQTEWIRRRARAIMGYYDIGWHEARQAASEDWLWARGLA